MTQPAPLFAPSLAERLEVLTPRRRFAYDLLEQRRAAEEVGLLYHLARRAGFFGLPPERPCACSAAGEACPWAEEAGRELLVALRHKGLVKRRRSDGLWERKLEPSRAPGERSSQSSELPAGF